MASCGRVLLLAALLVGGPGAATGDVGVKDFNFGPTVDSAQNPATAHKPQSKLWYLDGIWWATLFDPSGTGGHRIHALDLATQTWVSTGVLVDERPQSRQDALWDGRKLYLASQFGFTGGTPKVNRLLRFTYVPGFKTYLLDSGFPVDIPGGGTEALTLAKDSTGTLWIAYTLGIQVFVAHSVGGDDTQWSAPFLVPVAEGTTINADDIAGIIALPGKIGVFWSNQAAAKDYFAVHPDGADPTAGWTEEIAGQGGAFADDHLNLKLATDGRLFAAVKTMFTGATDPLLGLLVRSPTGTWSSLYPVGTVTDDPTRPQCFLDEVSRKVYVFYSTFAAIYYKTSDMDTIAFPPGTGTPFIENGVVRDINNPTGTKQNVTPETGLVVVASSPSTTSYWHNLIPPVTTTTTTTTTSTTSTTITSTTSTTSTTTTTTQPTTTTTTSTTTTQPTTTSTTSTTTTQPTTSTATSTSSTTSTTFPGSTLSFPAVADTYVQGKSRNSNFGISTLLKADVSPVRQIFLRFTVSGVGSRPVTRAVVRLTVGPASGAVSNSGGRIHRITNNSWSEATTTYGNRPAIDGPVLFTQGPVGHQVVDFDVTAAVTGDGTYNFALDSTSNDVVEYDSRQAATGRPALVLTLGR